MYNYIHIPFCRQKCLYCKFALTPRWQNIQIEKYLKALKQEIWEFFEPIVIARSPQDDVAIQKDDFPSNRSALEENWDPHASVLQEQDSLRRTSIGRKQPCESIESIYFGGGTPSVLSPVQISDILSTFKKERFSPEIEITLEANPEDITEQFVRWIREVGVNRLSLWVQTLNLQSLQTIGRSNEIFALRALDILEKESFPNVNVDLILWLPGVASGEIERDIRQLLDTYSCIRHVSVYMLENENYPASWKERSLPQEVYEKNFLSIREMLVSRSFSHYELSNFAREGYESRHNKAYWTHKNYRGFGLSAASYIDGRRFTRSTSFDGYYRGDLLDSEILTEEQMRLEEIMFRFRTFRGISRWEFSSPEKLETFLKDWYLREEWEQVFLNSSWIFILDYIMGELL